MRRFFQRFVKGLELVVETAGKILGVYKAAKETVKYVAAKISPVIKSLAGKACVYLKATTLSSLSSPMCFLQAANPYVNAAVGTLTVGMIVFSTIGALAT
jgi:hypothetical protein